MIRMTPEIRDRLKASGKWAFFVKTRQELRQSGMGVEDALKEALRRAEASDGSEGGGALVAGAVFAGKTASKAEVFNWVVANLYVDDVTAADAPDATAWTVLQMCRKSESFAEDLIGRGLVKMLPSKIEEEAKDDRFDGQDVFDAWAMIRGRGNG